MLLTGISLLGWVHSFACVIAIFTGAYVLSATKGTRRHRLWGRWYAGAMVAQSLLVMAVYRFDIVPGASPRMGANIFGFFHVSSLITMAAIALALFSAPRQRSSLLWALTHAQAMLFTYYMLISGLINELFARVNLLRSYAFALSPHAKSTVNTLVVRDAQLTWIVLWLAIAIRFAVRLAGQRRLPALSIGYPLRYSGGVFVACVGTGILTGGLLGGGAMLSWCFLAGVAAGIAAARRAGRLLRPRWGAPSLAQGQVMTLAVALEFAAFMILGSGGFFAQMSRAAAWETALGIVGFHFLIMRWSHGPVMLALGVTVLAWLGAGVAMRLSLPVIAAGDGLLKLGFGLWMAWPLLMPDSTDRSAPGCRPESRLPRAGFPG